MRSLVVLLAGVAIAACDNASSPGGNGIPPMRIAGTWADTITLHSGPADSCVVYALAVVNQNQNSDSFTGAALGQQTCYGAIDFSGEAQTFYSPLQQGEILGTGVRFVDPGSCVYLGLATGSPVTRLSGTVNCPGRSGTWQFAWAGPGAGST
jgi:hypothetical protein